LEECSKERLEEVIALENRIDVYQDKLGNYLTKLSGSNLAYHDSQNVSTLLHCITDLERISDHAMNIAQVVINENRKAQHFHEITE